MKWTLMIRIGMVVVLSCLLLAPGVSPADDVILDPGYISGTVSLGTYTIDSVYVNAMGNGFTNYIYAPGTTYQLTVQGGTWNYDVTAYARVQSPGSSFPYTIVNFKSRFFPVPIGATVTNDYVVMPGTIQFLVNITGDAYTQWSASANAYASPSDDQERTDSYSYARSAEGTAWNMPVVPNDHILVSATVNVDGKDYAFFSVEPDLLYVAVAAGQTVVVPLNIVYSAATGTVQGTIQLSNVDNFSAHNIEWMSGKTATVTANPGTYLFNNVYTGLQTIYAYSYFDNYKTFFWWPYSNGDPANNRILVEEGQTYTKDFIDSAGTLMGELKFRGTLTNADLYSYGLTAYGAWSWYTPDAGWTIPRTYGGWGEQNKSGADSNIQYRLFLTPGPWLPYYIYAYSSNSSEGYTKTTELSFIDNNYYYDGASYNFGQYADIKSGGTIVQNRDYCLGSMAVRYRIAGGGLVSTPRIAGNMNLLTPEGQVLMYVWTYGTSIVYQVEAPWAEVHGPAGPYTLRCEATTENGGITTFGVLNVTLECGVRKGQDISGPTLVVTAPAPNLITNAMTVTVMGTASDDAGITEISVNGISVPFTPTGNLHEVAFTYELAAADGRNVITVRAVDPDGNEATDERTIYVDRWVPMITISSPAAGSVYQAADTVPIEVAVADRGYGFSMRVYLDGALRYQANGPADDTAPAVISFSEIIGPLSSGSHVVSVEASDAAGNSATSSAAFSVVSSITATITVKPESRNNKEHGTCTIFVHLPDGLTSRASLNPSDTREITATPFQYPDDVRYAADEDKLILKFTRTPELMADRFFTVEGKYCPNPSMPLQCFTWKGSDTTKR